LAQRRHWNVRFCVVSTPTFFKFGTSPLGSIWGVHHADRQWQLFAHLRRLSDVSNRLKRSFRASFELGTYRSPVALQGIAFLTEGSRR
jgi:hypothetical protein